MRKEKKICKAFLILIRMMQLENSNETNLPMVSFCWISHLSLNSPNIGFFNILFNILLNQWWRLLEFGDLRYL